MNIGHCQIVCCLASLCNHYTSIISCEIVITLFIHTLFCILLLGRYILFKKTNIFMKKFLPNIDAYNNIDEQCIHNTQIAELKILFCLFFVISDHDSSICLPCQSSISQEELNLRKHNFKLRYLVNYT